MTENQSIHNTLNLRYEFMREVGKQANGKDASLSRVNIAGPCFSSAFPDAYIQFLETRIGELLLVNPGFIRLRDYESSQASDDK